MENIESNPQEYELTEVDSENIASAKKAHLEYLNEFAMANNQEMDKSEARFKAVVSKLTPQAKKALDDYFDSIPESERPASIALDY